MKKRDAHRAAVSAVLLPAMRDAQSALDIVSPYFVPGDKGSTGLVSTARRGSQVRILTNSLAANDVAAVHGGYSRYRKKLLKGGVQLWELKPLAGEHDRQEPVRLVRRQPAHQGAVDRPEDPVCRQLQPRSALDLAQLRTGRAGGKSRADRAVPRDLRSADCGFATHGASRARRGELRWADDQGVTSKEPQTTFAQRMQAWFARVLRHRRAALN